jgi:hypothetical protein
MIEMKWKNLLISGALVGAFSLGAMFAPIDELAANTNDDNVVKNGPSVKAVPLTANKNAAVNTCPVTGEKVGNAAGMMRENFSGTMHEMIAVELGMTAEELYTARFEGKSIAELAEEKGLDVNALNEKMLHARKAELEQLVKDGEITEVQKNLMLENMEARIKTAIEREKTGPMNGRGGGMGQGRGYHHGMGNQL